MIDGLLIIHDSSDLMFQLGVQLVQKVTKRHLEIFVVVWKRPVYIIMIDGLLIIHDSSDLMFQLGVQLVQKVKKRHLEIVCVF